MEYDEHMRVKMDSIGSNFEMNDESQEGDDPASVGAKKADIAYVALQQSFDALEEEAFYRYRQKTESLLGEVERYKSLVEELRLRLATAKKRQNGYVEDRQKYRDKIEVLRGQVKSFQLVSSSAKRALAEHLTANKLRVEKQSDIISGQRDALGELRLKLNASRESVDALTSSFSWRITKPLRLLGKLGSKLFS